MGVTTVIRTRESTNMQPMKKMTLITTRIRRAEGLLPSRVEVIRAGTCAKEMTQENTAPAATRTNTTAVVLAVEIATFTMSFSVMDL